MSRASRPEQCRQLIWSTGRGVGLVCSLWTCAGGITARADERRPNLVISSLATPHGLKQGSCNVFDVTVENVEPQGTSQTITVRLHLQYGSNGEGLYLKELKGIAAKGARGAVLPLRFADVALPANGRVSYSVTVNPDGVIPETVIDERNTAAGAAVVVSSCGQGHPQNSQRINQ